jgi:2'-5' RNA ligase
VVVPVKDAEPLVSTLRSRFDSSARQGMPAHITILYPFLRPRRLTDDVVAQLTQLCALQPALKVVFRRTARFANVLYLDPDPASDLLKLTFDLARQWPEAPPYGGEFDEIIPHLTVAQDVGDGTLDAVDAELSPGLPLTARLDHALLLVNDGTRWRERARLPFSYGVTGSSRARNSEVSAQARAAGSG